MMKKIFTLLLFLGCLCTQTFGQDPGYAVPKIEDLVKIPPSPEAQAFAKYGNTPVNLYTGTADVSIPLYTIQGKEFSIPVNLTYDASGVKVDQIATWAGLGWNLSLGGMITRQVRGAPDDYLSAQPTYLTYYGNGVKADYNFVNSFTAIEFQNYPPGDLLRYFNFLDGSLKEDRGTRIEIQPDVFSLSAVGLSGTIFVDYQTNSAYCIEHPDIEITPIFSALTDYNKVIQSWIIKDNSGNTFYFDVPEVTHVNENNSYDGMKEYNSAWGLTKIITKSKKDTFEFSVGTSEWTQPKLAGRADYRLDYISNNTNCGSDQLNQPTYSSPTYTIDQLEVSSVSLNGNVLLQIQSKTRSDLGGKSAIDYIRINDLIGNEIKRIKFQHSYFGETGISEEIVRLKLDKVEVYGTNLTEQPEQYAFQYNGDLPARTSFAQDFWGYYNGKTSNTTLIPYNYTFDKANEVNYNWRGASRRPNIQHATAGSLKAISYPTGGSTEFTYSLHQTADVSADLQELEWITNFGMVGGTTPTNNHNYCDDVAYPGIGFPSGITGTFNIYNEGEYEIRMSATMEGNYMPGMQYAAIYKTGDVDCDQNGNCNFGELQDFCDLYVQTLPWTYYGNLGANMSTTIPITLERGAYRFLMLNTDQHVTFDVQIYGAPKFNIHEVGGLRLVKSTDKDELGSTKSLRYYYYGDISTLAPTSVNPTYLDTTKMQTGMLGDYLNFEESRYTQKPDLSVPSAPVIECTSTTRYSNNRVQADEHVVYPIVSTVEFDSEGNFNGFEVTEFYTGQSNAVTDGFSKASVLNGRPKRKRVYNKIGTLLSEESTYYSQHSAGTGVAGFYFKFNKTRSTNLDMYIKSLIATPTNEFYIYDETSLSWNVGGGFSETHCARSGNTCSFFSYSEPDESCVALYGSSICKSIKKDQMEDDALAYFSSIPTNQNPTYFHDTQMEQYVVCIPTYNIIGCKILGGAFDKMPYYFPRHWAKTDSVVTIQYNGTAELKTITRNFYDNTSHFQPTRIEKKGSDGVLRRVETLYAHEMQLAEPGNPIWTSLISANRIAEPVQVKATYAANQPDFLQKTIYRNVTVGTSTVPLQDKIQLSSGAAALEDQILFHTYDNMGNILDLSRANDIRMAYVWGYDQTLPVATATNASSNEIFFTSFEFETDLGNSSDADCHTGVKSKVNGYAKTLTGLTATKAYTLTYWKKINGVWTFNIVSVPSGNTSYTISLTGQVDDVRFYPVGALMTTYTYKPLIGVTSASDPNDFTTFFEYDTKGRLLLVRDANGKILKQHDYKYLNSTLPIGGQN